MANFKFPKHADTLRAENEEYEKKFEGREKEIAESTALILNADLDKSSHGQLVRTEACNNWLAKLREERKNQFIGKDYMMRAPEFERDSEEVESSTYMDDENANAILTVKDEEHEGVRHVDDEFNPNVTEVDETLDETTKRFMMACKIDTTVSKCIGWDFDDLLNECADELEKEFGEDFKLPDDFEELVSVSLDNAEKMQLLEHKKTTRLAIPHLPKRTSDKPIGEKRET